VAVDPVPEKVSYAKAGVDRELRAKAKKSLRVLASTYGLSRHGEVLELPYGNLIPLADRYLDLAIEGVGTKVLLAQLADKYDTIGIDGVAVVVNDVIRSGATPLAIADNIHAHASNPALVAGWMQGLAQGAKEAACAVVGGEIGDVAELIKGVKEGKGFDMVMACIGEVDKADLIHGDAINPGDPVIGIRSSGLHSNGITLARKVLFKEWGGRFDPFEVPDGLERELVYEALEPTRIYVKPLQEVMRHHQVKGAVHITGDAYLKFDRLAYFSKGIGFAFTNFKPQPIFDLLRKAAENLGGITDEEMLKTFNMGWGFALVVGKEEQDDVLDTLAKGKSEAETIGKAADETGIVAFYKGQKLVLK
jgi:phosphoribosylformylglycinamidine cyclo-ligase